MLDRIWAQLTESLRRFLWLQGLEEPILLSRMGQNDEAAEIPTEAIDGIGKIGTQVDIPMRSIVQQQRPGRPSIQRPNGSVDGVRAGLGREHADQVQAVGSLVERELRPREHGDPPLQRSSTDRLEPLLAHPIVVSDGTDRDPGTVQAVNVLLDEPRAPFRRFEIRAGRAAETRDTRGMEMQVYALPRRSERDVHEAARTTLHPWHGGVGIDLLASR